MSEPSRSEQTSPSEAASPGEETGPYETVPPRKRSLELSELLRDQAARRQRGECVRAEDYLQQVPALGEDPEAVLDLIHHEILLRQQRGETPDRGEYAQRFPHLAGQLQELFPADQPPAAAPPAAPAEYVGRYLLLGQIAKGGMGQVLRVRDPDFQRTLAVKVLLPKAAKNPTAQRRFWEEARLTGSSEHPGIPPVHEMGQLASGLPYFAMKLVKGRTLAILLQERTNPVQDLPRFLGIFRQVCQTVAYAHSRGIIHRDLKPLNIMVGAFGEVQVMDWGLAKVIAQLAEEDPTLPDGGDTFQALRLNRETGLSHTGDMMGTPGYTAPEQARGEIRTLDQRCDVFQLGAILCKILTGEPPFWQGSGLDLVLQAADGNLKDAFRRLDSCGADAELIELARRCLAPNKEDRPRHAGLVAEAIERYEAMVQERLRQTELERQKAQVQAAEQHKRAEVEQARADEERRRRQAEQARADEEQHRRQAEQGKVAAERKKRRATLVAAVTGLLLLAGAAAAGLWYQQEQGRQATDQALRQAKADHERQLTEQDMRRALEQAATVRATLHQLLATKGSIRTLLNDPARWEFQITEAKLKLEKAQALLARAGQDLDPDLRQQMQTLAEQLKHDEKDRQLAVRLEKVRMDRSTIVEGQSNVTLAKREYPKAFAEANLDVVSGEPAQAAALVGRSAIKDQLVAALDDWAWVAWVTRDNNLYRHLLAVARLADPDPWRNQIRDPATWQNPRAVQQLADKLVADQAALARQSPQLLGVVGMVLRDTKGDAAGWLRQAQVHHPTDFWLNFDLANVLHEAKLSPAGGYYRAASSDNSWVVIKVLANNSEAVGYYRAALAVRPQSTAAWSNLGNALRGQKDRPGALAAFRKALAIDSQLAVPWNNLSMALADQNDLPAAINACRKALEIDPQFANAWSNLGNGLRDQKDRPGALAAYRKAVKIDPQHARAWNNLGTALAEQKALSGAVDAYKQALNIDPQFAQAWSNLGVVLYDQRDLPGALAAYRKAVKIDPQHARAWSNLGNALRDQKDLPGAVDACQKALKIDPQDAKAWYNLGVVLSDQKNLPGALDAFTTALKVDPQDAKAWSNLGATLHTQKNMPGAVDAWRKALKIDPQFARAWNNIGAALAEQKDLSGAVDAFRNALKIDPQDAEAWSDLGISLADQNDLPGAVDALQKAVALEPKLARAHGALGMALLKQGDFAKAHKVTVRALQLLPPGHPLRGPVQQQFQHCQQALKLEQRAQDLLKSKATPGRPAELLQLAQFCRRFQRPHAAAGLYATAFTGQPGLAEDLVKGHRYQAAGAAVLAAASNGKDSEKLTANDKAQLRRQALDWLRADLKRLTQTVADYQAAGKAGKQPPVSPLEKLTGQASTPGPADLLRVCDRLQRWQTDPDLVSLRAEKELAKLPAAEQADWRQLWADIQALDKQARASFSERRHEGSLTAQRKEQVQEVKLQAGKTYAFDLESTAFDPFLRLQDAAGKMLAENNDVEPGVTLNSRIIFIPAKEGTYRLVATSFERRGAGTYTLVIREFSSAKKE